ncbi:MAG: hypothetical protein ACIAS6_08780 [Phycisphaerales bacterium JB060]
MTYARPIAMLVSLAILLAGPVSSLAALADSECCCTETTTQVDQTAGDSCCKAEQAPAEHQPSQDEDSDHCPGDCDCCINCSAVTPPVQLSRPGSALDLPQHEPDTWQAFEPQSHAIEAHFSLLRPPRL